jgi:hypothetical protein
MKIYFGRAVMRIRIRVFLALLDPDTLVRGTDPEPDPHSDPDPIVRGKDPRIRIPHQNVTDPQHYLKILQKHLQYKKEYF